MEMFQDPTARGAAIVIVALLLTQAVKECSERWAQSKWALRSMVLAVCGLGALVMTWGPDGQVSFSEWWGTFGPAVTTAEFSWQWALKALGQWRAKQAEV